MIIGAENHEGQGITPAQAKANFLRTCAHEVGHALDLSSRRIMVNGKLDTHDGGVYPTRYNGMEALMKAVGDPLHPEHTWLRHEEWERASEIVRRKYLLP